MSVKHQVAEFCNHQISLYPELETDIVNCFDLFTMEIDDDCTSVDNEAELLYSEVNQLISAYRISTTG